MPGGRTLAPSTKLTGKRGRPSSLTPETKKLIVAQLLNLGTYEDAALAGGVHPATFERWLAQGAKDYAADKTTDYREFYEAVANANRSIKTILRGRALSASARDGKFALKILERRWPKEWGLKIDLTDSTPKPQTSPRERIEKRLAQIEDRQTAALAALREMLDSEQELAGNE